MLTLIIISVLIILAAASIGGISGGTGMALFSAWGAFSFLFWVWAVGLFVWVAEHFISKYW